MTFVAAFSPHGHPVLLGDLLLSGKGDRQTIDLPGPGTVSAAAGPSNSIVGLTQKLSLVSQNLAVGWAGSQIAARYLVREMKAHFCDGTVSPDDVFSFIDSLDLPEKVDVSLVGMCNDGNGIRRFQNQGSSIQDPLLGSVHFAGSGHHDFLDQVRQLKVVGTRGEVNPLELAVTTVLSYTGFIFVREILEGANLASLYGGGFELITPARDADGVVRFQKMRPTTYLFWRQLSEGGPLTLVPVLINFQYRGEDLIITRLLLTEARSERYPHGVMTHLITPVDAPYGQAFNVPKQLPNLDCFFLVTYVIRSDARGRYYGMMIKKGGTPVTFRTTALELEVEFSESYKEDLGKILEEDLTHWAPMT